MSRHKEKSPQNSLFSRIVLQLTVPLILLATLLTALQVNNQLSSLNKFHLAQGQWVFAALEEKLQQTFPKIQSEEDLNTFSQKLKSQLDLYNLSELSLFDYLKRVPFDPQDLWGPFDLEQIEKALLEKQQNKKPYSIAINKDTRRLIAYIPMIQPATNNIYIVRGSMGLSDFKQAVSQSRNYLLVMTFFIIIAGSIIGYNLSKSIVKPILLLNQASGEIIRGNLGKQVAIHTHDELEILANTFNHMSSALEEMRKKAIDSNPLTGLPGNQGIFGELKKRILERQKFVLFHIDLDRFKVFNDHYGLAKGDEAIKGTAALLKRSVEAKGAADDYVGHQGGDDFVVITRPQKAEELAKFICAHFDSEVVPSLYSKEDIAKGTTSHVDRRLFTETGVERLMEFPLLAISLAGVSTVKRDFADHFQCMNLAAAIKKEVKKNIKSSYIIKE